MYKVVDLFAGAGGLSLGFMQTQKFEIKVAFENNPNMQDTYRLNHPDVDVRGDVCEADYKKLERQYGKIDVVIGGPPCQGFSNANRQRNHAISQNNMLVKQYIRAIIELQPKAFIMENVSMLKSDVHRFYLDKKDQDIVTRYRIPMKETEILLLDKEYVFDGAVEIVKDKFKIDQYMWPEEHYFEMNVIFKACKNSEKLVKALEKHKKKLLKFSEEYIKNENADYIENESYKAFDVIRKYYNEEVPADMILANIEHAIMIQRMLGKAKEIFDNELVVERYLNEKGITACIYSYAVYDYLSSILQSNDNRYVLNSKVLCAADYGAPQKRMRFVIVGIKRSISDKIALPIGSFDEDQYRTVRDAISDLEDVTPVYSLDEDKGTNLEDIEKISDLGRQLRNTDVLKNHIVTKTTDTAMERFKALKQGQNFHALDDALKSNTYTDVSRTQNTIYLRLNYDEPSGTVVNVRKSMWIHPTLDRAISVREAARLQTFPDSFVFCGTKDKQYQQVGNAVPPIMAKAIAEKIIKVLDRTQKKE